jgi:hypothetical protein
LIQRLHLPLGSFDFRLHGSTRLLLQSSQLGLHVTDSLDESDFFFLNGGETLRGQRRLTVGVVAFAPQSGRNVLEAGFGACRGAAIAVAAMTHDYTSTTAVFITGLISTKDTRYKALSFLLLLLVVVSFRKNAKTRKENAFRFPIRHPALQFWRGM